MIIHNKWKVCFGCGKNCWSSCLLWHDPDRKFVPKVNIMLRWFFLPNPIDVDGIDNACAEAWLFIVVNVVSNRWRPSPMKMLMTMNSSSVCLKNITRSSIGAQLRLVVTLRAYMPIYIDIWSTRSYIESWYGPQFCLCNLYLGTNSQMYVGTCM